MVLLVILVVVLLLINMCVVLIIGVDDEMVCFIVDKIKCGILNNWLLLFNLLVNNFYLVMLIFLVSCRFVFVNKLVSVLLLFMGWFGSEK